MLLFPQTLPKVNQALYRPWLWARSTILRQRIVVTLAPDRVDLALFQRAKLVARFEEPCESTRLSVAKSTVEGLLKRIPGDWRAVPCHIVVCSNWVQWSDVPWLGAGLKASERQALASKRLSAMYGDSAELSVAIEPARFGRGQLVAGLSRSWIKNLNSLFHGTIHRLVSIEAAHTLAWNAVAAFANNNPLRDQKNSRDALFVTLEGETMTLAWVRRNIASKDVAHGIRNVQSEGDDGAVLRQIQRECVLQRLVDPSVCVALRRPQGISEAMPANWQVLQVSDWGDIPSANGMHLEPVRLDFIKADKASKLSPWHNWMFALAIACICAVGAAYVQWSEQLSKAQDAFQQYSDEQDADKKLAASIVPILNNEQREQRAKWQHVQNGLLRPWEPLFQCIESSVSSDVTLMQIQPDALAGELHLTGDARSFKAIGKFVQALQVNTSDCSDLRAPYLSSFQINEQDPQRTLHFEVNARWLVARNSNAGANP